MTRRYDKPRTPSGRLRESGRIERNGEQGLKARFARMNPAALQREREELRDRAWDARRRSK